MLPLTPLCELAKKYETDKGGGHFRYNGAPCEQCHEYTRVYWDIFKDKRNDVKHVLEIGVNSGASLRMWREFFPNAQIIGLDIDVNYLFDDERIACFQADAGSADSLLNTMKAADYEPGEFDLIVDDGSHELDHQKVSLNALLPFLAPKGLYIVEDCYYPGMVLGAVPDGFSGIIVETDNNRGGVDYLVIIARV